MKLSSETINLLQSFAQISANLLVKPGNKISIRNAQIKQILKPEQFEKVISAFQKAAEWKASPFDAANGTG